MNNIFSSTSSLTLNAQRREPALVYIVLSEELRASWSQLLSQLVISFDRVVVASACLQNEVASISRGSPVKPTDQDSSSSSAQICIRIGTSSQPTQVTLASTTNNPTSPPHLRRTRWRRLGPPVFQQNRSNIRELSLYMTCGRMPLSLRIPSSVFRSLKSISVTISVFKGCRGCDKKLGVSGLVKCGICDETLHHHCQESVPPCLPKVNPVSSTAILRARFINWF